MKEKTGFIKLVNEAKSNIKELNITELKAMIDDNTLDGIIIDIREKSEYNSGAIPGSIHISRGVLEAKIEGITHKEQNIYLYCGGGSRSALSADSLQRMGYKNVYSIAGGYRAWVTL